ncbi:MAG: sigma 54-interacting transcriptional regulator [Ignavibacteriae bacterium]|nr:sigma 54-interacting transcriptional regulator [Ignavibacteriota bacterium]MCB9206467.1 sigma 54-interacting transcriptional regulator [Ignavibacteriales bacterium]MCB9210715.1 sigma 54-interacting transcriptional regulator [Ignavibacteriales bacterium]MCB9219386.1 sigma 54-interacting transcriptional regulator [Ignavibacteriales bacterium]
MQRKQHKNSLTRDYAEIILDCVADGVFTVDNKLIITYFNKAAERISGISKSKAIGQFCFDVLKSNICETECPIRFSFSTGKEIIDKHKNILRVDGKKIPITISASILKDKNGKMIGGVETFRDLSKIEALEKAIHKQYTFEDIISKNHKVRQIFNILPNIAESDSSVLIQGESGTGKELFARALHNLSHRKNGPFIAVNCGALPDNLLESELFGYVKGAFTDAKKNKPGRFELANGGSIFLDEIDSMPISTQVKLLRVLQEKEFEPLGATHSIKSNVRIISATKFDLNRLVQEKKFRDDLFYRLDVVKIELPTLKERKDDIPLLVQHFIEKFNHHMHKSIIKVSDEVMKILLNLNFEGNVRQLENIIEHAFVMCQSEEITIEHLPTELIESNKEEKKESKFPVPLKESERSIIIKTLDKNHWNTLQTSIDLKIHRSTLWRKMKKYDLFN